MRESKRKRKQRPLLLRVLGSPKTTLVLGIFALASIIYYKVNYDPGELKKTKTKKKFVSSNNQPLLLKKEVLGRTRKQGPLLSRSFFKSGDLVLTGKATNRNWGIVLRTQRSMHVVHPFQKTSKLMDWLRKKEGRFALYRILASTPAQHKALTQKIAALQRDQAIGPKQQKALQLQWLRDIKKSNQGNFSQISPVQWVDFLYRNTGIKKLPTVKWTSANAPKQWLEQLIAQSHYNDLLK